MALNVESCVASRPGTASDESKNMTLLWYSSWTAFSGVELGPGTWDPVESLLYFIENTDTLTGNDLVSKVEPSELTILRSFCKEFEHRAVIFEMDQRGLKV
jgi:hypothetical protein